MQVEAGRHAVVTTIATRNESDVSARLLLCQLNGTLASLRGVGWDEDVVCLTSGFSAKVLSACGCSNVVEVAMPSFDAGPAAPNTSVLAGWMLQHRRVPPPLQSAVQMHRFINFGDLTAIKLSAWTLIQYDLVLHTDLDVHFFESPQAALEEAQSKRLVFQAAHAEVGGRSYSGFNSHMMILKPNPDLFAILRANAALGHVCMNIPSVSLPSTSLAPHLPTPNGRSPSYCEPIRLVAHV